MMCLYPVLLVMALGQVTLDEAAQIYEDQTIERDGHKVHYRLLKPEKIEPGQKYPVVLSLHGAGERGSDNVKQLMYLPQQMADAQHREKFPCFLIAPQCPAGQKWANINWSAKTSEPQPEIAGPMQDAVAMLEHVLKTYPTDPNRVYLTGLSMGGYGSWDLATRHPEWFAAVVPICGGGDERQAKKLVGIPLWAVHGDADRAVPVERSQQMIAAIKEAGGEPKYSELPGVGHNSWTPAYKDLGVIKWMFAQKKSPAKESK